MRKLTTSCRASQDIVPQYESGQKSLAPGCTRGKHTWLLFCSLPGDLALNKDGPLFWPNKADLPSWVYSLILNYLLSGQIIYASLFILFDANKDVV